MPYKDLHEEPFDESTIVKLEIFEDYAKTWIPTFVMQGVPQICIFDFFAGMGYDIKGVQGSPIRILEKIKTHIGHIFLKKVKIKVYLNEFEPRKKGQKKFALLKQSCDEYLEKNKDVKRAIEISYHNEDFEVLFPKLISEIKKFPSLVYLDQNGIKFLSNKYLLELEKTKRTDFLYFISSSYFNRFGKEEEIKKHVDLDIELLQKNPYNFIHRNVIGQLRKKLPTDSELKLYPFSFKKNSNVFGIVFCAKHPAAFDKFLTIAWERNKSNGEADFDIENEDFIDTQIDIWGNSKRTKVQKFKDSIKEKILDGIIKNNFDALQFAYQEGHIGKHAAECLKEMKNDKIITFEGASPLVTYENVYKLKKKLEYKILQK